MLTTARMGIMVAMFAVGTNTNWKAPYPDRERDTVLLIVGE